MSKRQWLCILGVWVMIFLFLGVPSTWHKILALVTGLIVISIAYNLPSDSGSISSDNNDSTFIENNIDTPK